MTQIRDTDADAELRLAINQRAAARALIDISAHTGRPVPDWVRELAANPPVAADPQH